MKSAVWEIKVSDVKRSEKYSKAVILSTVVLGLYLSSFYSYLLFHCLIEIATITIGFTLFILTWNARSFLTNSFFSVIGIGYAFIAFIDLLHTLAYKGMDVFPGYGTNLPTQLWIAARSLQAVTLFIAPFFLERKVDNRAIWGGYAATVLLITALVYTGNFPACYVEGKGLTAFKIGSEYLITALLITSLCLIYFKRKHFKDRIFKLMAFSIACTALSEISFTAYLSVYGVVNMSGHYFKLAAFYLIYRALLVTGLKEPYELIFRELKNAETELLKAQETLEGKVRERTAELRASEERYRSLIQKVQTAIVLHDDQGRILDSNLLAQKLLGLSAEQLLGKELADPSWHLVREDGSELPVAEYPVSMVLATQRPLRGNVTGIYRPDLDRVMWVLVNAEPEYEESGAISQIIVSFIDISERKLAEELLRTSLGSYRMAQAISHVGNWEYNLQTTEFWGSDEAKHIYGFDLGQDSFTSEEVEQCIPEREQVHRALVDLIEAGVPYNLEFEIHPRNAIEPRIITSVAELLRDEQGNPLKVVGVIQDITERKRAEETLRRLNRELQAISNCTQVLMKAADEQTLITEICRIVCEQAGYRMAWVGYVEYDRAKSIRPAAHAGVDDGYLDRAGITWAETERGLGPSGIAIRTGQSDCIQDFATDVKAIPWREEGLKRGYRSSISLPLKDENAVVFGALSIYSSEPNAFTPDEIRLLEELAGDLAFGITALRARVEREQTEEALRISDIRFGELFNRVAVPLFFVNKEKGTLNINLRFMKSFGYSTEDIPTLKEWWQLAYPDPTYRKWVIATCEAAIERAVKEKADIEPIEYRVTCKNGDVRIMVISGCAIGQDFLLTFFDVTERKRMEDALREGEKRYRIVFENSPVSIWEEDFSGVKAFLDNLRAEGVSDIERYFDRHPEGIRHCAELAEIIDVNRAAIALHGAASKEELLAGLANTFTPESFATFRKELICLWNGGREMVCDATVKTFAGEPRFVTVYFSVCPGYEDSLGKILVSLTDISARKEAEEALMKLNAELDMRVKERTAELERKNKELERANRIFVGRELRMIELKEQIRELEGKIGGTTHGSEAG